MIAAIGRVDYLKFEQHDVIEGMLVAETVGKQLSDLVRMIHDVMREDHAPRWLEISDATDEVITITKTRGDAIYAVNLDLAESKFGI
jgi:phage regulator Rha-like protein